MDEINPLLETVPKHVPQRLSKAWIIGIVSAVFLFFLLIIAILFVLKPKVPKLASPPLVKPQTFSSTRNAPEVIVNDYSYSTELPALPTKANSYQLKSDFTQNDAQKLASLFNLKESKNSDPQHPVFYDNSINNRGLFSMDLTTGSFFYESYGSFKLSSRSAQESTTALLTKIGLQDGTIVCNTTYQRKDTPNDTFVECHRDWKKLDAPLVTLPGLLNMGETTRLSNASPGKVDPYSPLDKNIINVSTGQNGYARPNDFNTITFQIRNNERIISIHSNVRWIESQKTVKSELISPTEALAGFKNNKAQYSLTLPSGKGTLNWDKVYPQNKAIAQKASIKEIAVVYVENMQNSKQSSYIPSYMIRGTADLDSGYTVDFVQTIPAVAKNNVLGTSTSKDAGGNIKLGTFTPTILTPTPTSFQSTKRIPTQTPSQPSERLETNCLNTTQTAQEGDINIEISGYGTLTVYHAPGSDGMHTYFLKSVSNQVQSIYEVRDLFFQALEEQEMINLARFFTTHPSYLSGSFKADSQTDNVFDSIAFKIRSTNDTSAGDFFYDVYPGSKATSDEQDIRIAKLKKNITQRIQNANLSEYASQPDIFPPETLKGFSDIFSFANYTGMQSQSCYISGGSPFIFLYPVSSQTVTVTTGSSLTYSDPAATNNSWSVMASPLGTVTSSGQQRDGIYYEYDKSKINFTKSNRGFLIKRDELTNLLSNLAVKLGLNSKETVRLNQEVNNALIGSQNSKNIIVSFAESNELNSKLPLNFSPNPNSLNRIMLLLNPTNSNEKLTPPVIIPVARKGFTVVEIGAKVQ